MTPVLRPLLLALAATVLLQACSKTGPAATASAPAANASAGAPATTEEAAIRKNIAERLPNLPAITEIRKTPIAGLFEVRVGGSDIFYSDANGDYLIQGAILDTRARKDLTKERMEALTAVDFSQLPFNDALVTKRGNGERKLAVFEDPNCPYCHKFESELAKVDNVTIYTFLLPILSEDSLVKSRNIWCAKDRNQAWAAWMLRKTPPATASADCDIEPLKRNTAFAQKYRITGTPALLFPNGKRVPGAVSAPELEKLLAEAR